MFPPVATTADKIIFKNACPDGIEDKASGCPWKDLIKGLKVWSCVDTVLNADKRNGRGSIGRVVMIGNTPVVSKSLAQIPVEKSTHGSEFAWCSHVIDEALPVRDMLHCFGYKIDHVSRIFCDNKGVILAACVTNMRIRKRSSDLELHKTREYIASGAI